MNRNSDLDTIPHDVDKKLLLGARRDRDAQKEIGESHFRLKSFSTVERLNDMYENDIKVLDCEALSQSPKKRFYLPAAKKQEM